MWHNYKLFEPNLLFNNSSLNKWTNVCTENSSYLNVSVQNVFCRTLFGPLFMILSHQWACPEIKELQKITLIDLEKQFDLFFSSKMVRWPLSVKQLTTDFTTVANSGIHNGARSSHYRSCVGMIPLCILVILVVGFLQVSRYQYKHGESVTLSISVISVFWVIMPKMLPCKSKTGLTPVLIMFSPTRLLNSEHDNYLCHYCPRTLVSRHDSRLRTQCTYSL